MKKSLLTLIIVCFVFYPDRFFGITIHTIGDSTMEQKATDSVSNPNGQCGWPQMLSQFVTNGAIVNNRAKSGTSSKTFYEDKDSYGNYRFWPTVKPQIKAGDYVFIQFGHNDEKDGGWQSDHNGIIYTGIGTNPWEQYTRYLCAYVNEVRALGATPILFTPIVRNSFSGTTMTAYACHNIGTDSVGRPIDYPAAMKKVADSLNVLIIDHTALTKAYCEQLGQAQTTSLIYNVGDGTHLGIFGATTYARLAAKELIRLGILTDYLNANPDLLISTNELKYGKSFVNASTIYQVSISGTDLTPATGTITLSAPKGYSLSTSQNGAYSQILEYNYTLNTLNLSNFYVRFKPSEVGSYNDTLTIGYGAGVKKIALKGECVVLTGQNASVSWELSTTNQAVVTGPVDAIPETYSNMKLQNYAAPNATTTWTGGLIANGTKTQRNVIGNETGAWPSGEIDIVNNRYIQFGVSAIEGSTFSVDSIGLYAGGAGGSGMRFKVYISKDSLFSNTDVTTMIADRGTVANASNTMYPCGYNKLTELNSGESLYLRIFPWYNGAATGKTICLYGLLIKGVVTLENTNEVMNIKTGDLSLSCYPTITTGKTMLNFKPEKTSEVIITVKSIDGKTLINYNKKNQSTETINEELDFSTFSHGVYLCTVITGNKSQTIRIIKR